MKQRSISVLIKGCRIKRCPKEDMKVWVRDFSVVEVLGFLIVIIMYLVMRFYFQLTLSVCVWQ